MGPHHSHSVLRSHARVSVGTPSQGNIVPLGSTSTLLIFNEQIEFHAQQRVLLTTVAPLLDALLQPTITNVALRKISPDLIVQQFLTSSDKSAETLVNTKRRSILRLGSLEFFCSH
jgi:hypothetical protein